ncbi:MAG TPA: hypothetical protein VFT78_09735 [Hanamia sp.]|nr:hypothetical protein [Hanamia sp.]
MDLLATVDGYLLTNALYEEKNAKMKKGIKVLVEEIRNGFGGTLLLN